ncbi:unnamed protein product [Phaedon cochleariae]|uniref:Cytoplasmic tRNA 2-thiolation protein 2 n=1 Tax=Phaedon cochleariae TaxID=80249 RepID=A0A9P0DIL4_PHACE|nr:unnamed protein product [Phaedon cochleariae]
MCSVGDDDFENDLQKVMPVIKNVILSETCNKCRARPPLVVLRSKDFYCKDCFLTGTTHKFRALLGKSRLIRPNDIVLVHHQIGHPSTALLHFLRSALDLSTPKKLQFKPVILFIDNQYHLTVKERLDILTAVEQEVNSFEFNLYFISFAKYIANPDSIEELITTHDLTISENDKDELDSLVKTKCSLTNKNDIKTLFQRQLLLDVARHLKCKFVFTPDISIDIASQLLSNVSLGRGSHISVDTGFCDDRDEIVKILKPLRLFDMKELALYNKFNKREPLCVRQPEINPYSSIQDLMKTFVNNLQSNFPATVTTIIKTGDKLTVEQTGLQICTLCKNVLSKATPQLRAEDSTNFSHLISTQIPDQSYSREERYLSLLDTFEKEEYGNKDLCYACYKISNHMMGY